MLTIRYFAAARAARGVDTENLDYAGPLGPLLQRLAEDPSNANTPPLREVLDRCTFLLNGVRVEPGAGAGEGSGAGEGADSGESADVPELRDGDRLDILPPFAGG